MAERRSSGMTDAISETIVMSCACESPLFMENSSALCYRPESAAPLLFRSGQLAPARNLGKLTDFVDRILWRCARRELPEGQHRMAPHCLEQHLVDVAVFIPVEDELELQLRYEEVVFALGAERQ